MDVIHENICIRALDPELYIYGRLPDIVKDRDLFSVLRSMLLLANQIITVSWLKSPPTQHMTMERQGETGLFFSFMCLFRCYKFYLYFSHLSCVSGLNHNICSVNTVFIISVCQWMFKYGFMYQRSDFCQLR